MKTTLANTESNLTKIDSEVEQETVQISKLEEANSKLRSDLTLNEQSGTAILAEMGAIDEEKK